MLKSDPASVSVAILGKGSCRCHPDAVLLGWDGPDPMTGILMGRGVLDTDSGKRPRARKGGMELRGAQGPQGLEEGKIPHRALRGAWPC